MHTTRPVVLAMQMSLDGYTTGPDGDLSWMWRTFDDEMMRSITEAIEQTGTQLLGRRSYEAQAAYWPASTEEIAPLINAAEKVVFSRTLDTVGWTNARLATRDVADEIAGLRRQPGGDIRVVGGAVLARDLISKGLIDEYDLIVHPVLLGNGAALLGDLPEALPLTLVDSRRFGTGALRLRYRNG